MPKNRFYGINKLPKGKKYATIRQSFKANQVRRWGEYGINKKIFDKYGPIASAHVQKIHEEVSKKNPKNINEVKEIASKLPRKKIVVPHKEFEFMKQIIDPVDLYLDEIDFLPSEEEEEYFGQDVDFLPSEEEEEQEESDYEYIIRKLNEGIRFHIDDEEEKELFKTMAPEYFLTYPDLTPNEITAMILTDTNIDYYFDDEIESDELDELEFSEEKKT